MSKILNALTLEQWVAYTGKLPAQEIGIRIAFPLEKWVACYGTLPVWAIRIPIVTLPAVLDESVEMSAFIEQLAIPWNEEFRIIEGRLRLPWLSLSCNLNVPAPDPRVFLAWNRIEGVRIALLWTLKLEWGINCPYFRRKDVKQQKKLGELFRAYLRLCQYCHMFSPLDYRNAAHWFAELVLEYVDRQETDSYEITERVRKPEVISKLQTKSRMLREEKICKTWGKHESCLMKASLELINGGDQTFFQDYWNPFLAAFSGYINFVKTTPDIKAPVIKNGHCYIQLGQGKALQRIS